MPYPYDAYHDCDITLGTLESVLAHFSKGEEELFSLSRRVLIILEMGLDHMDLDKKDRLI
jgi:hypothetical protein